MRCWLSFSLPLLLLTAGRAESMFSDEGILRIKHWRKDSPIIMLTAEEYRWALGRNGQEHQREGSHGDVRELSLGSLFLPLGYDSANQGYERINCLTYSFTFFIFLNIGLGCNCMKLYHFLHLENDFILFCIFGVRWHKVTKILTQLKTDTQNRQITPHLPKVCSLLLPERNQLTVYQRMWLIASGNCVKHSLCRKFSDTILFFKLFSLLWHRLNALWIVSSNYFSRERQVKSTLL